MSSGRQHVFSMQLPCSAFLCTFADHLTHRVFGSSHAAIPTTFRYAFVRPASVASVGEEFALMLTATAGPSHRRRPHAGLILLGVALVCWVPLRLNPSSARLLGGLWDGALSAVGMGDTSRGISLPFHSDDDGDDLIARETTLFVVPPQCEEHTLDCWDGSRYDCTGLSANDLCFECRTSGPPEADPVLLLHGFPHDADFWLPLTDHWIDAGVKLRTCACNLRGYSPGASPDDLEAYDFDVLVTDVWALADAAFGPSSKFSVVAHDHGAVLGWVAAAQPEAKALSLPTQCVQSAHLPFASLPQASRLSTFVSLAVPHPDVFSSALYGENAVAAQQFGVNCLNPFQRRHNLL